MKENSVVFENLRSWLKRNNKKVLDEFPLISPFDSDSELDYSILSNLESWLRKNYFGIWEDYNLEREDFDLKVACRIEENLAIAGNLLKEEARKTKLCFRCKKEKVKYPTCDPYACAFCFVAVSSQYIDLLRTKMNAELRTKIKMSAESELKTESELKAESELKTIEKFPEMYAQRLNKSYVEYNTQDDLQ